jgi:hypothetical protein
MAKALQLRGDSEENWLKENPILDDGEIVVVSFGDEIPNKWKNIKIGDGISTFEELPYLLNK